MRPFDNIFMIGIGGMGMAPLAIYLAQSGCAVRGCDDDVRPEVRDLLTSQGIALSDCLAMPSQPDRVVYSSAIGNDHPVFMEAIERGLPLIRRGEMLAQALADKKLVAIAGSHGKTTTTGMLIHGLAQCGFEAGYVLGALFNEAGPLPARFSNSEWVIVEIDESDGTIEGFSPEVTLFINSDWDHCDYYTTKDELDHAFERLLYRTRSLIVTPSDYQVKQSNGLHASRRKVTFGEGGDYVSHAITLLGDSLQIALAGSFPQQEVSVSACGLFNAENALAALTVAHCLAGEFNKNILQRFPGIMRRQTRLYHSPDLTVIEDYAHHPVEIESLLKLGRDVYPDHKQIVVFQPHRYSRTAQYKAALARALAQADDIYLLNVYPAHESPLAGGRSEDIFRLMVDHGSCRRAQSVAELSECHSAGDQPCLILFVGAGDIDQWSSAFTATLPPVKSSGNDWWQKLSAKVCAETRLSMDEPLANKTTLRVGGAALYYVEPGSVEDLRLILTAARQGDVTSFVMGRGSNLIVSDEGFSGLVVRLTHECWKEIRLLDEGRMWVGAGVRLKQVCAEACRLGLSGFEFLEGIPGSLGGALRMNAGAMGGWIFDLVEEIELVTLAGDIRKMQRESFHVDYRNCHDLHDAIAIHAVLRAPAVANTTTIREALDDYSNRRKSSQPREPSAGCIFKNPDGNFAGKVIDELNLKGRCVGAAQVSTIHGNFIINRGGATSRDVITLIKEIRQQVKDQRGIDLQPEVMLLGRNWEQVL